MLQKPYHESITFITGWHGQVDKVVGVMFSRSTCHAHDASTAVLPVVRCHWLNCIHWATLSIQADACYWNQTMIDIDIGNRCWSISRSVSLRGHTCQLGHSETVSWWPVCGQEVFLNRYVLRRRQNVANDSADVTSSGGHSMSAGWQPENLGHQQSTVCWYALPGDWCRQNVAISDWVCQRHMWKGRGASAWTTMCQDHVTVDSLRDAKPDAASVHVDD